MARVSIGGGRALAAGSVLGVTLLVGCAAGPQTTAPTLTSDPDLVPSSDSVVTTVVRVVDGDTIRVVIDGQEQPLRLIGIDTPETVKPNSPVECFGPEASDFAAAALADREVIIEFDASQGREDRFGRLLGYVWVPDADGRPALFNLAAVTSGYAVARAYGDAPARWESVLARAQQSAIDAGAGLWSACPPDERP